MSIKEENNKIRKIVLNCNNKGMTIQQITDYLNKQGLRRPSNNAVFSPKDIQNRLYNVTSSNKTKTKTKKIHTNSTEEVSSEWTIEDVKQQTGLSQAGIARILNVNPASVGRWKRLGIPLRVIPLFKDLIDHPENLIKINETKDIQDKSICEMTSSKDYTLKEVVSDKIKMFETELPDNNHTLFVVTKDKEIINRLLNDFLKK